jgi:pimeloyl-ACP methyl ester carboxylesterase
MKAIPGSRLVAFSKSGHMPMLEEQEEFVSVVTNFLHEWRSSLSCGLTG